MQGHINTAIHSSLPVLALTGALVHFRPGLKVGPNEAASVRAVVTENLDAIVSHVWRMKRLQAGG